MELPDKLNSFERFLFFDDYSAYPNTIGCSVRFSGVIDQTLLDKANEHVFQKHPLLFSKVAKRFGGPVWSQIVTPVFAKKISSEYLVLPFSKKIDLLSEPAYQMFWTTDGQDSRVYFLTHHAAADGIGGLQFVVDWLRKYANEYHLRVEKGAPQIKERSTDMTKLRYRGRYGFRTFGFLKKIPKQMIGLMGVWEFMRNRPVVLKPMKRVPLEEKIPDGYPGLVTFEIGKTSQLRGLAIREQVTTNDIVLANVLIATARWRRENGLGGDNDLMRMIVPFNLRTVSDRKLPAANRASLVSIDRRQSECVPGEKLLKSIRFQMEVIKKNELGYTFLHMLNLYRWLPGGLRRVANPKRTAATVLVTNLGEPFRKAKLPKDSDGKFIVGNLTLDGFDLMAPLRPNTNAAIAVFRYAGKLLLSMNYDNRVLTVPEANQLIEMIGESIREDLNKPPSEK